MFGKGATIEQICNTYMFVENSRCVDYNLKTLILMLTEV